MFVGVTHPGSSRQGSVLPSAGMQRVGFVDALFQLACMPYGIRPMPPRMTNRLLVFLA